MRLRMIGLLAALTSMTWLAAATYGADEAGRGGKGGKRNQLAAEKVDINSLPPAVVEAAKKEVPNAALTSAERHMAKRQGAIYTLAGTDGKYHVSLTISSSGELLRLTKALESKGKKKAT